MPINPLFSFQNPHQFTTMIPGPSRIQPMLPATPAAKT
jgi:hypothetical protein